MATLRSAPPQPLAVACQRGPRYNEPMAGFAPLRMLCFVVAAAAQALASAAQADPAHLAEPPTRLVERAQIAGAYADHPLVAAIAGRGWLLAEDRQAILAPDLPVDRAWAAVDALGGDRARAHGAVRYLLLGVAARLSPQVSAGPAADSVRTSQLDARAALMLGWAKLLADPIGAARRRDERAIASGSLELLSRARAGMPHDQAANLAWALAEAAASEPNCADALALLQAARRPGQRAVRLAAAERADAAARAWVAGAGKDCASAAWQAMSAPIQLPPPVAEAVDPPRTRPPPPGRAGDPDALLVVGAPFFRGYVGDPVVRTLLGRAALYEAQLVEALTGDPNGDRTLAVLNAALHGRRTGAWNLADLAWRAVIRAQGLAEADPEQQRRLKVAELKPVQALVLAYSLAIGQGARPTVPDSPLAIQASVETLFAATKGALPLDAKLGPLVALGWLVDSDRGGDLCKTARRAEALRVTVGKTELPAPAAAAFVEGLMAVEAGCPAKPAP